MCMTPSLIFRHHRECFGHFRLRFGLGRGDDKPVASEKLHEGLARGLAGPNNHLARTLSRVAQGQVVA